jgi:hypothetical protein
MVFRDVTSCRSQRFEGNSRLQCCSLHKLEATGSYMSHLPRWREQVPSERWHLFTSYSILHLRTDNLNTRSIRPKVSNAEMIFCF